MKNKVTIIGAGNGGLTAAYHITKNGYDVCLYDSKEFDTNIKLIDKYDSCIEAVENIHGQKMKFPGKEKISLLTTNPKLAAEFSEFLFFICPSFAQEILFKQLLPYLNNNHIIILMPGNYGSLCLKNIISRNKKYNSLNITFVDAISIPWATRHIEKNKIAILGIKEYLSLSIWPKKESEKIINKLKQFLSLELRLLDNPLVAGLENINFGGHPLMTVCNIGLLENFDGKFNYYKDCCSTPIANACSLMDEERINVGKAYGWKLLSELDAMNSLYNSNEKSVYDFNRKSETHVKLNSALANSHHRYITEDVPYLLVPCYELAKKVGLEPKIIESIIHLASAYNKTDYFKVGRTLEKMGLNDKTISEIKKIMEW